MGEWPCFIGNWVLAKVVPFQPPKIILSSTQMEGGDDYDVHQVGRHEVLVAPG